MQKQCYDDDLQDLGELDGVCTFCEMAVPLVSRIAESLGLPGNAPDAVDAARDKHNTRAKMQAAGLPTPRNMLIQQPSDMHAAAEKVKFPAGVDTITCIALLMVLSVVPTVLLLACSLHKHHKGDLQFTAPFAQSAATMNGQHGAISAGTLDSPPYHLALQLIIPSLRMQTGLRITCPSESAEPQSGDQALHITP